MCKYPFFFVPCFGQPLTFVRSLNLHKNRGKTASYFYQMDEQTNGNVSTCFQLYFLSFFVTGWMEDFGIQMLIEGTSH